MADSQDTSVEDTRQPVEFSEPAAGGRLFPDDKPWRKGLHDFSPKGLKELKDYVEMYEPLEEIPVQQARLLLVGQIGAGKSSFFNTINSIYRGYVTAQAASGTDPESLTTKYRSYEIRSGRRGKNMNFRLCDTMGLEDAGQGLDVTDFYYLLDGYVPDSFEFKAGQRLSDVVDIKKVPELKDKVHVLAIVIDAVSADYMPESITAKLREIRQHALKRAIPVVVVLTHIDNVCDEVRLDITKVYHSRAVFESVKKAAEIVRMPPSQVIPIKNYETETELDRGVDILALFALRQLIRLSDNFFDEQMSKLGISLNPPAKEPKKEEQLTDSNIHESGTKKKEETVDHSSAALPPGWQVMKNKEGKIFYRNSATNETRTDKPQMKDVTSKESEKIPDALPTGWQELTNAEGKTYYFNEKTAAVQYERPQTDPKSGEEKKTPLPSGWQELTNAEGKTYYFNEKTAAVQHERPQPETKIEDVRKKEQKETPLPPGWQELSAADGGKMYLEVATHTITPKRPIIVEESPLPPGWQELTDPQGGKLYLDVAQNNITKERPKVPDEDNQELPPGWTELTDPKGGKLYLEVATNQMSHERPRISKPTEDDIQPLPEGWQEMTNPEGGKIYVEVATNKISHERPKNPKEAPLPPGWQLLTDESGMVTYFNAALACVSRERPILEETPEVPREAPLPDGWQVLKDPDGKPLYVELATNLTTRVRPGPPHPETYPVPSAPPPGASADAASVLPPGWVKMTDESGQPMYLDRTSGVVTREQPVVLIPRSPPMAAATNGATCGAGLLEGWAVATAADGRTYYYNASTGATTWERPSEARPQMAQELTQGMQKHF